MNEGVRGRNAGPSGSGESVSLEIFYYCYYFSFSSFLIFNFY